jgi:fructose-1,6-bisphosphatase
MLKFDDYLRQIGCEEELSAVLKSIVGSIKDISKSIKTSDTGKAGSLNVFGEEQLALDIFSNKIIENHLKDNPLVGIIASEELPDEIRLGDGEYGVCFDPLDGSSLVDVNLAVGSIFGIYKTKSFIGIKGDDMLAAVVAVYGPRTTFVITIRKGVQEFVLSGGGDFVLSKEDIKVSEGKMFAPGNLRACGYRQDYLNLITFWCKNEYTLRYSGGMVPDINQILIKGKGIFSYPGYEKEPNGKLRLLFECGPASLLMEEAFGAASDGKARILSKPVVSIDQRMPIFIGSKAEVRRCEESLE